MAADFPDSQSLDHPTRIRRSEGSLRQDHLESCTYLISTSLVRGTFSGSRY